MTRGTFSSQNKAENLGPSPLLRYIKKSHLLRFLWIYSHEVLVRVFVAMNFIWVTSAWFVYRFESVASTSNIKSFGDALWWGVVTFLTVGYGDRYPVTFEGRCVGVLLMTSGVIAIGITTARISSHFLAQVLRHERGEVMTENLNKHFIVCGVKDDMAQLLIHILQFNPGLKASELVLIGQFTNEITANLKSQKALKKLQTIQGDYSQELVLKRAAPERARKVLILADRAPVASGAPPSVKETDARTLMTAMLLSHIARGVSVSAEILDPSMDSYLRMAGVSEVIHSREYNRLLLANASGGTGLSNIIFDLLDPQTPTVITTLSIPDAFVGKEYGTLKQHVENTKKQSVVIGLLENTGNSHLLKDRALRNAQKTADMGHLVKNLQAVKEMKFNHPVFNPVPSYKIVEGCTAIVIETRQAGELAQDSGDDSLDEDMAA